MVVNFVFVGEGASDDSLMPHLENLCIHAGATEVSGVSPDFRRLPIAVGHTVEAKLKAALVLEPQANLVFVHRDADGQDAARRYAEIAAAAASCRCDRAVVGVVPVRETEAWLLLDEAAIRHAVGRPRGRVALGLPRSTAVEREAHPKERLQHALDRASEATGRRLDRIRQDFPHHRRALLLDLPIVGAIEGVPSWRRLRDDVRDALRMANLAQ